MPYRLLLKEQHGIKRLSGTNVLVGRFLLYFFLFTNVTTNTMLSLWYIFSSHGNTYLVEAAVEKSVIFES